MATTKLCAGKFRNAAKPLQHDNIFDGQIWQSIREAIKSINLISLHYATRGSTPFPLSSPLMSPHLSPLPLFLIYSCNPPHPSPSSSLPPYPTYLTVFKLMSTSPSDHAPQLLTHHEVTIEERKGQWNVIEQA